MLNSAVVQPSLPAVDLERARQFYEQKLGLKPLLSNEPSVLIYQCGAGTSLALYQRGPTKADNTAAHFKVKDLQVEVDELKSRGVVFEEYNWPNLKTVNGIAEMNGTKAAWFKDSEGNILGITQVG